jgi:inosose dehydratase
MKSYARRVTEFGEWCAEQGMPLSYHHHMAAVVETEPELDSFMNHSGAGIPLLLDAGHLAFAGGDVLRAIDHHHKRINHVHVKDIRRAVIDGLDRRKQSFLDAVALGAFTVPGDGSLDFGAIVKKLAGYGYEGWFVVEAEQDPKKNPPLKMAQVGHKAAENGPGRLQGIDAGDDRRRLYGGDDGLSECLNRRTSPAVASARGFVRKPSEATREG